MHHPPRDPRIETSGIPKGGRGRLVNILKRHNVTAVFAGHIHSYIEDCVGGIPVFISGGGGARREDPVTPYHYLLCTVESDGSVSVTKQDVDDRLDWDKAEHFLQAEFPGNILLYGGVALMAAGLAISSSAPGRRWDWILRRFHRNGR
jgi:hypothetical protein